MNDKDLQRTKKIVAEVLAIDQRGKLFRSDGKKINADDIAEIVSAVAGRLQYFMDEGNKPKSRKPIPNQISFEGEIVGLKEPEWVGGDLCPGCGGGKTEMAAGGVLRVNCHQCGGAGTKEEWDRRKAERSVLK